MDIVQNFVSIQGLVCGFLYFSRAQMVDEEGFVRTIV